MADFQKELSDLINRHSKENGSNTPDFIIGEFLSMQIKIMDLIINIREKWYGRPNLGPGQLNPKRDEQIIDLGKVFESKVPFFQNDEQEIAAIAYDYFESIGLFWKPEVIMKEVPRPRELAEEIRDIKDINVETGEGRLLFAALAKLTTESQTDKTPWEVIQQCKELADRIYEDQDVRVEKKMDHALDEIKENRFYKTLEAHEKTVEFVPVSPKIEPGFKFESKGSPGYIYTVKSVNETTGYLSVEVDSLGKKWTEDGWNLKNMIDNLRTGVHYKTED